MLIDSQPRIHDNLLQNTQRSKEQDVIESSPQKMNFNDSIAYVDETSELGVGLFKSKEEYDNVCSELDVDSDRFQKESP